MWTWFNSFGFGTHVLRGCFDRGAINDELAPLAPLGRGAGGEGSVHLLALRACPTGDVSIVNGNLAQSAHINLPSLWCSRFAAVLGLCVCVLGMWVPCFTLA